jgi:hypothetical protein
VIASKAVVLISGKRQSRKSITNTKPIILAGALVFSLTLYKKFDLGKAPSLAMANPILEVTVIDEKPAKKMFIRSRHVIETAPIL